MIFKIRDRVIHFINSGKANPVICGLAIGLYPLFYYYERNFSMINSWSQFMMFVLTFILAPMALGFLIQKSIQVFPKVTILKFGPSVLTIVYFAMLLMICTIGIRLKFLALALVIGTFLGIILVRHLNKVIVFQLLLALTITPKLMSNIYHQVSYSTNWQQQPDQIVDTKFNKFPNIYIIQPDGYPNFSELKKGHYGFDNSGFENFLSAHGFKFYEDFRSNYISTLSSNSSMFSMKHHFYNHPRPGTNDMYHARDLIVGDNAVVKTFKNNGYKTNLLLEKSYLLVNRPKIGYDFCNVDIAEISFLARGFEINKDIVKDLVTGMDSAKGANFYFIEKLRPGHISNMKSRTQGKEIEREKYLEHLAEANQWLAEVVGLLEEKDPYALVVIVADHGGFVGFDYTRESKIKQTDANLIRSIFTTALAIKWPHNDVPEFDDQLKTNVNLFRVLITYLSGDKTLLENLQPDNSYIVIEEGAPFGVYEYIDGDNKIIFEKITPIN